MVHTVLYKIFETDGKKPVVNIAKILKGLKNNGWIAEEKKSYTLLKVCLQYKRDVFDLKRRLAAKKNRPNTIVEIIGEDSEVFNSVSLNSQH